MPTPSLSEPQPLHPRLPDLRNFRDVGGLRTSDGRSVRHGVVYRSATPSFLDDRQTRVLAEELGVRTRVDLRSSMEIAEAPHTSLETIPAEHLPLRAGGAWRADHDLTDPSEAVAAHYRRYLEHSPESIGAIVGLVAEPTHRAVLVHCSAGKDRTGVALAVMLSAVGVADEEIVSDYARTREDLTPMLDQLRLLPAYKERLAALPEESLTAEPRSMELFLEGLAKQYGGARGYLCEAGVDEALLARLRSALVDGG
jgi:protein-tyrosine phosphatase